MFLRNFFEKRSAFDSDLTNPQPWLIDLFGGPTTSSGERVTTDSALMNSNVYTVASILGGDVGKLPIQLFKRKGRSVQKDTDHPVSSLLGIRPNPYMSAYTFKELMMVHLLVWGNCYANIEWGWDGYPVGLWPLNPSVTDVHLDPDTGKVWYSTILPNGEPRKLLWTDLFHLKLISKTGLKGITPISVLREEIGVQQSVQKFLGAFYSNGTATRGILKVPAPTTLDKEAKVKVREEWQNFNSGITNAHRIAILDGGLDYQNLGMPLKDAEFIESRKFGILEVAKLYKMPPHKLGQLDRATFSNIEQQSIDYVKNTLLPYFVNWEQEINYKLFTASEQKKYYTKFNVTGELRGDSQSRAQFYKEMVLAGIYSINEVRELEEREGIGAAGDKHLVPLNYTTIENIEKAQGEPTDPNTKGGDEQ
ncbi:phage portal protein [Paenibacillus sp. 32352]|uniref:phage portal protein n=1 Tax=Paenibacillus sp. 32352 TaxID=1969111 RepID=UPI0009AE2211|nr:phage portal protein [Paenibacillus sp. 32352]